jgi:hypothetical protein
MKRAFLLQMSASISLWLYPLLSAVKESSLLVASWELKLRLFHWPKSDIMAIQIHH